MSDYKFEFDCYGGDDGLDGWPEDQMLQDIEDYDRAWEQEYENDFLLGEWLPYEDDDHMYQCFKDIEDEIEDVWNESPWLLIQAFNIHDKKLQDFMELPSRHRRFDKKVAPNTVVEQFYWWDEAELHKFACNKGYMNAHKKVMGIIRKHAERYHTEGIITKLLNHVEYKTTRQFKTIADQVISAMRNPNQQYPCDFGYKVQEHGFLYKPGEPVGYYFPYAEFDEYSNYLKQRAIDQIGYMHGVSVYSDCNLLTVKVVRNRKKPIIITKSIYELFENKTHESWLTQTLETVESL